MTADGLAETVEEFDRIEAQRKRERAAELFGRGLSTEAVRERLGLTQKQATRAREWGVRRGLIG